WTPPQDWYKQGKKYKFALQLTNRDTIKVYLDGIKIIETTINDPFTGIANNRWWIGNNTLSSFANAVFRNMRIINNRHTSEDEIKTWHSLDAPFYDPREITTAELAARQYAEAQAELARVIAEAYADGRVTEEEQARIADAEAKLNAAKEYAEQQVDAVEVGGRNLITDSKERTIEAVNDWTYRAIYYGLARNTTYTISFEAEFLEGQSDYITVYPYLATGQALSPIHIPYSAGIRMSATFTTDDRYDYNLVIYAGKSGETAGNTVKFKKLKLERGNKPTDWSPAPEDVEAYAEHKAAEAQAAAEAVARAEAELAQVNAEAYADGKVSAEEQARIDQAAANLAVAKSHAEDAAYAAEAAAKQYAEQQVDAVEVGGRNLLLLSDVEVTNAIYGIARYDFSESPIEGETYTLTLKGTLGEDRESFRAYNSGGSIFLCRLIPNEDGTIFSKTFTWRITSG
ncbi:MAG: hypothetical protein ACE3NC_04010, partial [Candidatus Wallacebacter cryptica]